MSHHVDQRLCETVCRNASVRGWVARIDVGLSSGAYRVIFMDPSARRHKGKAGTTKAEALTHACRKILRHLAS